MEYSELIDMIDGVGGFNIPDFHDSESKDYHDDYWQKCKDIQEAFKETRFPTPKENQKQWDRFCRYRNDAFARKKSRWESKVSYSKSHRDYIMSEIYKSEPTDLFGFAPVNRDELVALGKRLKNARHYMTKYKHQMVGEHKQECFEAANEMQEIHDSWWTGFKQAKYDRKQDFIFRTKERISANYERLEKARGAKARCESHIDDLHDKLSSARSDEFSDRVSEWLSEAQTRLSDIEESISRIEGWIDEDEAKLS